MDSRGSDLASRPYSDERPQPQASLSPRFNELSFSCRRCALALAEGSPLYMAEDAMFCSDGCRHAAEMSMSCRSESGRSDSGSDGGSWAVQSAPVSVGDGPGTSATAEASPHLHSEHRWPAIRRALSSSQLASASSLLSFPSIGDLSGSLALRHKTGLLRRLIVGIAQDALCAAERQVAKRSILGRLLHGFAGRLAEPPP